MYKIVKKSEGSLRKIADNKTTLNLITKDITPEVSLAFTEATDYYEKETTAYNRIYYVTKGTLVLIFDGKKQVLEAGDSCFICKNTEYEMSGTFKAVAVNQPAFGT